MPKVWNIGNTTVRNPKRIENALRVFVQEGFSGNVKGAEMEQRLHLMLKERGVLEFEGEPSDLNGRKWRAAFYQLGFISDDKYKINSETLSVEQLFTQLGESGIDKPYQVTLAGKKLIEAKSVPEIEDIYLRQFVCYELPNSLEPSYTGGKLKPFILFLQILRDLQKRGHEGLNKFETGLFLQLFQDHTKELQKGIIDEIIAYRNKLGKCKNVKEIKLLRNSYLKKLEDTSGINPLSVVNDYSDTTFRYFNLSGLFTRKEETIVIRDNKIPFVDKLLESEPKFLYTENPITYFQHFYNNTYPLPIDVKEFALQEVTILKEGIRDKSHLLFKEASTLTSRSDLALIQSVRHRLIIYNGWEREEDYAAQQQSQEAITDTLRYLKTLNGEAVMDKPEIDDKPAYLEWAVWRCFLSIDEIVSKVHETRRFPVDQDFMPRNTAPGGGSDLLFEFENYVLAVEVTLTFSHRQMAVESEPVKRHTVQYKQAFPGKEVYCIFIAPKIDNNVAENFRSGVWYNGDAEEFVNIIPINLSDFNKSIEVLLKRKYRNSDYRAFLDRCLSFRTVRTPQWKEKISREVDEWAKQIMARKEG